MDWQTFTPADVLKEFTPAESATLNSLQGAVNNLPEVCAEVVAEIRQAISDAGGTVDGNAADTIPAGFKAKAAALARWRWLIALPQAKTMQSEPRKDAAVAAEKLIEDIASGKRPVAAPAASGPGRGTKLVSDSTHPFGQLGGT